MAIANRSLKDLSPRLLQLYEQARDAYKAGNLQFAVATLSTVVKEDPGCCDARKALRAAQLDLFGGRPEGLRQGLIALRTFWAVFVAGPALLKKRKVIEALDLAEKVLMVDPGHRRGLLLLSQAAELAELPQVGCDALEVAVKLYPDDARCWRALADHCMKHGNGRRAVAALRELRRRFPDDVELKAELNQAKAIVAMGRNRWEKATGSGQSPTVLSVRGSAVPGGTEDAPPEETPRSDWIERVKHKATILEKGEASPRRPMAPANKRPPSATETQELASGDGGISRRPEDELAARKGQFDDAIEQWREYARRNPEHVADAEEAIAEIEKERQRFLTEHFEDLVKRYPTDPRHRFELGKLLFQARDWDYAIEQFQVCRKHPYFELRSVIYLGKCMREKGLSDLSLAQFETAAAHKDYAKLGEERLGIDYELALLYEGVGRHDDSAALLKRIYAEDITFRDVACRVEKLYKAENRAGETDRDEAP